jgi:hypothetical protein
MSGYRLSVCLSRQNSVGKYFAISPHYTDLFATCYAGPPIVHAFKQVR